MSESTNSARAALLAKIVKVMESVDQIEKTGTNQEQHYKFVKDSSVMHTLRKAMIEHRLAIVPVKCEVTERIYTTKSGGTGIATRLAIDFHVYDAETGDAILISQWPSESNDTSDKSTNKALTASWKNLLLKLFMVPTDTDDQDQSSPEQGQTKAPKAKADPQAPPSEEAKPKSDPDRHRRGYFKLHAEHGWPPHDTEANKKANYGVWSTVLSKDVKSAADLFPDNWLELAKWAKMVQKGERKEPGAFRDWKDVHRPAEKKPGPTNVDKEAAQAHEDAMKFLLDIVGADTIELWSKTLKHAGGDILAVAAECMKMKVGNGGEAKAVYQAHLKVANATRASDGGTAAGDGQ